MQIVKDESNKLLDMNEESALMGLKKSTLYALVMRKRKPILTEVS